MRLPSPNWVPEAVPRSRPSPALPPERCEYFVRPTLTGLQGPGLVQQRAVEALHGQAAVREPVLDAAIPSDRPGLVAAVPEYRGCPRFLDERVENILARLAAQDQRTSSFRSAANHSRPMQPPPRRSAWRPISGIFVIKNEHRQNRLASLGCGGQRRVIGGAQIEAEPNNGGARFGGSGHGQCSELLTEHCLYGPLLPADQKSCACVIGASSGSCLTGTSGSGASPSKFGSGVTPVSCATRALTG